jgi:hypothetical protein
MLETTPLGETKVNRKISHRIKVVASRDQTARSSPARARSLIHYHFGGIEVNSNQWLCPG